MKGVYTLVFMIPEAIRIEIGSLGAVRFEPGTYAYIGSALGTGMASLKGRITRHISKRKRIFWHIDYLLIHEKVRIIEVICARTNQNIECEIVRLLRSFHEVTTPVEKFGASDCRSKCGSHLCHIKTSMEEALRIIIHCYHKAGQKPIKLESD
ncbi:MAG: DUF123 domain-containing protein [Promethearchaeota archaeon]